jgi:hypothetical protein
MDVTLSNDQSMNVSLYSDAGDLSKLLAVGMRSVPSTLKSSDGTQTGQTNEVYVKFKTSSLLQRLGVFQFVKNSFVLDENETVSLYDSTNVNLNSVAWIGPAFTAFEAKLQSQLGTESTNRTNADTAIRTDTQAALDGLAVEINTLIATPAA